MERNYIAAITIEADHIFPKKKLDEPDGKGAPQKGKFSHFRSDHEKYFPA